MIKPFADESTVQEIGGITVENRFDRVSLFGSLDLTRDQAGLAAARELKDVLSDVVEELEKLEKNGNLPETVEIEAPELIDNPFKED